MKIIFILILYHGFAISFCSKVYCDQLYLKGLDHGIDVTIKKTDKGLITATILKRHIVDIAVNPSDTGPFPDILEFLYSHKSIHCKIIEIEDNAVHAEIPMVEIASFNIDLSAQTATGDIYYRTDMKTDTPWMPDRIKDRQWEGRDRIIREEPGIIKGKLISLGNPLPGCQVKIYRLVSNGFLFFKSYKQAEYYETITDNSGNYLFEDIPAGAYKLYWKSSLGEPWMMRIETEPDIIVMSGEMTIASPLDIGPANIE